VRGARALPCLALVCALAGCATTDRLSAAGDVHRLLVAVRDDDQAAFDAHVDRAALKARIQARLVDKTRTANLGAGLTGIGLWLSGPIAGAADSLFIQPSFFRAVADYYGYKPGAPIPGVLSLATVLTALPDGKVCVPARARGPCLLTFANEDRVWRLVDIDAESAVFGAGKIRR